MYRITVNFVNASVQLVIVLREDSCVVYVCL